jgi:hypothetical protein
VLTKLATTKTITSFTTIIILVILVIVVVVGGDRYLLLAYMNHQLKGSHSRVVGVSA